MTPLHVLIAKLEVLKENYNNATTTREKLAALQKVRFMEKTIEKRKSLGNR